MERFEHQNKREDPHTGNIFRMKGPSVEVLDDIGDVCCRMLPYADVC